MRTDYGPKLAVFGASFVNSRGRYGTNRLPPGVDAASDDRGMAMERIS
ncbi:hypothetical protein MPC4_120046 [Methylocella tundrae]|uniref:Uncharacterized protein n=1 Tax=Methylocella tundrae TaxID=227605 RepID=A0A8B6M1L5_METTU|nr:hypothetical protein MPC4_120046 [Methylocella tundrae]